MSDYDCILYEVDGPIATITLDRPEKLNALNRDLIYELIEALDRAEKDEQIRVIILTGAGRAFSSGYDLSPGGEPLSTVQDWRAHATIEGCDLTMKLWDLSKPSIAAIQGYALGGGCDLALSADLTIAADGTLLGAPEIRGVSSPLTMIIPWLTGVKKAKELLLTGDMIDAEEAERIGLINKVVPQEALMEEAKALALRLAMIPPVAVKLNKIAINRAYEIMGMKSAIAYGAEMFTLLLMTDEAADWGRAVAEKGLKTALVERDAAFKEN